MSASRSSASNLLQNRELSFNSSNQNLRASFNAHQTLTKAEPQNTVEYASFNIKPSQYKQTGIFLPINNNTATTTTTTTNTTNGGAKKSVLLSTHSKKQLNLIRQIKDDLEVLIQRLRNVQKNRHWSFTSLVDSSPSLAASSVSSMEQFKKLADEFNEKISQQLTLIGDTDSSSQESHEYHVQLRQLHAVIKQNCSGLSQNNEESGECLSQDSLLSNLSKSLNDFMQNLDKLNSFYACVVK